MKLYALNIAPDSRILSACMVLSNGNYDGMPIVESLPEGNILDYFYINNEYVYNPLPKEEPIETPSQLDIVEAKVSYIAMMTGLTEVI